MRYFRSKRTPRKHANPGRLLLALAVTVLLGSHLDAQVPTPEREALIALFNSTQRNPWTNSQGWLQQTRGTECSWYGVTCEGNSVVTLLLEDNGLWGELPPEISQLTHLRVLNLRANRISGRIPPELGNMVNLESLKLSFNGLEGSIPPELAQLSNLKVLTLNNNELTGEIPPQLGQMTGLVELWLGFNRLTGGIPPEIGQITSLQRFSITSNQLSGGIPPELGQLSNLDLLDGRRNRFTGMIPPELGQLGSLAYLFLPDNQLLGRIPAEFGQLSNLEILTLSGNDLSGPIPGELGSLASLRSLRLEFNRLSGELPIALQDLTGLRLDGLDLRANRLSSANAELAAFLNSRQCCGASWESMQNIAAVYPQVVLGGGCEATLTISSFHAGPWSGRVYLNGGLWPEDRPWTVDGIEHTGQSWFPVDLSESQTMRFVLGSPSVEPMSGWLTVSAAPGVEPESPYRFPSQEAKDASSVATSLVLDLSSGGTPVRSFAVSPAEAGRAFVCPVDDPFAETAPGEALLSTGIAARSFGSGFLLDLHLAGRMWRARWFGENLPEDASIVGLLSELLEADEHRSQGSPVGSLVLTSSTRFFATATRLKLENGTIEITSIPLTKVW